MLLRIAALAIAGFGILHEAVQAQAVEVTDETAVEKGGSSPPPKTVPAPKVGPEAAKKYFQPRQTPEEKPDRKSSAGGDHYLSLTFGPFVSESTYRWGKDNRDDVGQVNVGVTYKVGEWTGSSDLDFKADIITYSLNEGRATKLSIMPAFSFPEVESGFPLYFGAAAGLGVFLKQIPGESNLSFDYSIFAGARFFRVIQDVGFSIESGLKNHLLLTSDGQFNGVYLDFGLVFQF